MYRTSGVWYNPKTGEDDFSPRSDEKSKADRLCDDLGGKGASVEVSCFWSWV